MDVQSDHYTSTMPSGKNEQEMPTITETNDGGGQPEEEDNGIVEDDNNNDDNNNHENASKMAVSLSCIMHCVFIILHHLLTLADVIILQHH